MTIAERVFYLRTAILKVSMQQMSEWAGKKTRNSCNNWEKGRNVPDGHALMRWQKTKGINPDFIMYGKKPIFLDQDAAQEINQKEYSDRIKYIADYLADNEQELTHIIDGIVKTISAHKVKIISEKTRKVLNQSDNNQALKE